MNNPFAYIPTPECDVAFCRLTEWIESVKNSDKAEDRRFYSELEAGKMLGVLLAEDEKGGRHTLYAFSGQLGAGGFYYPGFVGPVFDYLQEDGYFKSKEREISAQNVEILKYERDILGRIREEYQRAESENKLRLAELKEIYGKSKKERDLRRAEGNLSDPELSEMIRRSQYEKGEIRREKKRLEKLLEPLASELKAAEQRLKEMKKRRKQDSEYLQEWLFSNFLLLNARGEKRSLKEIFADTSLQIPPSGAGECAGPKLLQEAYRRGLQPIAMAEYWYGVSKGGEVRVNGSYYPACRGKCLPVLRWMLQGLDVNPTLDDTQIGINCEEEPQILFENEWFCVVSKPAGILSVPGKSRAISVQQWLEERYGAERGVKVAHRLDQATSGLLLATFGNTAYKIMQRLFAARKVKKTYVAELEGDFESICHARKGRLSLPLSADFLDRPRQRIDFENGKEAITEYEFIGVKEGRSRVRFYPLTGRTHQLRVHSAAVEGLGMPISGDRLYGGNKGKEGTRLMLHAHKIEFTFPIDGQQYSFESSVPF